MFECSEEVKMMKTARHNWKVELKHSLELNYGLLDDLVSGGLIKYEDQVETFDVKSSSLVQRGRVLDVLVKKWPACQQHFLEALKTSGQEHVAHYLIRNGCKLSN
jgi:Caspase recruitment domain